MSRCGIKRHELSLQPQGLNPILTVYKLSIHASTKLQARKLWAHLASQMAQFLALTNAATVFALTAACGSSPIYLTLHEHRSSMTLYQRSSHLTCTRRYVSVELTRVSSSGHPALGSASSSHICCYQSGPMFLAKFFVPLNRYQLILGISTIALFVWGKSKTTPPSPPGCRLGVWIGA
jgi:hypothetical protein